MLISLCIKNIKKKFSLVQIIPLLIILISLSVMYGWFVHSQSLVQIIPSFAPMQFNTALCFLLLSIGLITLNTRCRTLGIIVVLSALLLSILTLLQYIFDSNYGIDMLFVDPFTDTKTSNPGRMAPNTAVAMVLTGVALYMSHSENNITHNKYYIITVAIIGNLVFALGIVPVIGYLTDVEAAYGWSDLTRMAIHTAICFSLIGNCILINLWTKAKTVLSWLSSTAGYGLLIVSLSIALAVSSQNKVSFNTGLNIHTDNLSRVIETQLNHTYSTLQRVQKRLEVSRNIKKIEWESDVKEYMEEFSYVSSMMLLDSNLNISMIEALTSNIYRLNKKLNIGNLEKEILDKSISNHTSMSTNVFINSDDKKVFLYYVPLRINDKLDGVIVVEIEIDSLFKKILEHENLVLINVLNDSGQVVYSDFPNNILKYNDFINTTEIQNNNITWILESYPSVNSLSKRNTAIPWTVFIVGCLTSILVSLSVFLGLKEKFNLEVIRKQSEEQAKLLNIIDSMPDFIGIADLKGNLQYHNKSAKLLVGLPEDYDMSQKNIKDMHPHHVIEMMEKTVIPTVFKKDIWKGNSFLLHANGHEIPVSQILTLYRDKNRSPVCFTTIMRDITEQNEIDRIKKEFISTVSHELRTPLTSIRGSLGLIIGSFSKDLPEKINKLLDIANKNSERLILLINDILDIDKIASGQMRFNMKEENFSYITQQAVKENMSYAEKFNTNINLGPINKDIKINVDAARYTQVLSNLLSNAAKFSRSGGNIDVTTKRTKNNIRISVQDYGDGIPKKFRPQIFSKFYQVDSSSIRSKGGTGLGLHISKEIVEKMGGKIGFEAKTNKGTIFWVEFPIITDRKKGKKSYSIVEENPLKHNLLEVLHVEDNVDLSNLLNAALQDKVNVINAPTIKDAQKLLRQKNFSTIIIDIALPDGSGEELLDYIIENVDQIPPVLIFSATEMPKDFNKIVTKSIVKSKMSEDKIIKTILSLVEKSNKKNKT